MLNFKKALKSFGLAIAVVAVVVIYAYGFKVTKVNLAETRSETRQTQLIRIIRALAKPDLVTYEKEEFQVNIPYYVPCPVGGYETPPQDTTAPYLIVDPPCAEAGSVVKVTGYNFESNISGPINFIPPSEVSLTLGQITTDINGYFETEVKLPKRDSEEIQYIRAVTRRNVGSPMISQTALDTWDKIIETVFLALLATTLGTMLAVPLSFFAARNLMKDMTSPLIVVALQLLVIPVGVIVGVNAAHYIGQISGVISDNVVFNILGLVIGPLLAYLGFKWALPPEDIEKPGIGLRVVRFLVMVMVAAIAVMSLFLLSSLLMTIGKALIGVLGSFGFIGKFFADLGDILEMIMVMLTAIGVAGVFSNFAGKVGRIILKTSSGLVQKSASIISSVVAIAVIALIIMLGVDKIYQIGDPKITIWWPAGIGGMLGLALALRYKPKDPVPIGLVIYYASRTIFNALRSIEALIMVIVFVVWVGIGPFAGVLALSLHTIAALAKLYSEQVESILAGPIEAVKATGANQLQTIVYAVIPQIIPPYISFTMYRWDINVRMSTIIGFAGGGGIGFLLIQNINLLSYRAASVQMIAIALVVASMDYVSSVLRERVV